MIMHIDLGGKILYMEEEEYLKHKDWYDKQRKRHTRDKT